MTLEKIEDQNIENKDDKIDSLRLELKKLVDDAKEKKQKEIDEGVKIKNGFDRHLLKLSDEDIKKIPAEHLEFWDHLKNMEQVDMDKDYDKLSKKIQDLFSEGAPDGMRSILAHKLVELVVKSRIKKVA